MTPSLWLSVSIIGTVLLAVFLRNIYPSINTEKPNNVVDSRVCEAEFQIANITGECFFRDDYNSARALFLKSAKVAGAELLFLPVVGDLGTDVAILRGTDHSNRFLIHLSGIHGVEGYAGSAVQSAALQYLAQLQQMESENESGNKIIESYPTIVFLHAMNPYGFANNRRVNEENVDLNRNFLTVQEFDTVRARNPNYAGYIDLNGLINPTVQISQNILINDSFNMLRTLLALLRFGLLPIKKALVSGNYHKQDGVGFGGFSMATSVKNLIDLVQGDELGVKEAEQIVLVDVHTGLGPTGVDTLMSNPPSALHKSYPTEMNYGSISTNKKAAVVTGGIHTRPFSRSRESDAISGYDLTVGQTTSGFCDNFLSQGLAKDKITCVLQEIGTVDPVIVGRNMIAENYAYFHGTEAEKTMYTQRYRDCFYVQTNSWKRSTLRRGLKVILQSLLRLGANPENVPIPAFQV